MNLNKLFNKKGFPFIESIVVIIIFVVIIAVLTPVINGLLETVNQSADIANARLIYNATAAWFAEYHQADNEISPEQLDRFINLTSFPLAKSKAFGGKFSVSVTSNGEITVKTDKPVTFDPLVNILKP